MRRAFLCGLMLFASVLWVGIPQTGAGSATIQTPSPLASLPPCNFNAYTERDDLIIGAVLLNLETGDGCTQNLNTVFPFASVGKLFVAAALYQEIVRGNASFEDEITFTNAYYMGGRDDCLNENSLGLTYTVGYLGNIMISCSDNAATWMLMDYVGWENVQAYIDSLGITGIGPILPYSYVDRLKLSLVDDQWAQVPPGLASRFYRGRETAGLVPTYFNTPPIYNRDDIRAANADYLLGYNYNTATPRAMTDFLLKLANDVRQPETEAGQVAFYVFNTMLRTQRVFSTQEFPGNVYVGSKNGFDLGYRAEVNITLSSFENRQPQTISVLVVRHRDVMDEDVEFQFRQSIPTLFLRQLSGRITEILYPNYPQSSFPTPVSDERVREIAFNREAELFPCWQNFLAYDYLGVLQDCWSAIPTASTISRGDFLGVGIVLRYFQGDDARITLVYTLPDGTHRSYQIDRFFVDTAAIAWFEEVPIPGTWRVDVYLNLRPVFSQRIRVE